MAGVKQRPGASGKQRVYKYEGFLVDVPSSQTQFNVSTFERKHAFDNHLARFRPRGTAHIQSPPSNNAVSLASYYPRQQGLITE